MKPSRITTLTIVVLGMILSAASCQSPHADERPQFSVQTVEESEFCVQFRCSFVSSGGYGWWRDESTRSYSLKDGENQLLVRHRGRACSGGCDVPATSVLLALRTDAPSESHTRNEIAQAFVASFAPELAVKAREALQARPEGEREVVGPQRRVRIRADATSLAISVERPSMRWVHP